MRSERKMSGLVTARFLRSVGACDGDLLVFRQLFPHGARVTERNVFKALRAGLSLTWLVTAITRERGGFSNRACAEFDRYTHKLDDREHRALCRVYEGKHETTTHLTMALEKVKAKYDTLEAKKFVELWRTRNEKD